MMPAGGSEDIFTGVEMFDCYRLAGVIILMGLSSVCNDLYFCYELEIKF